LFSPLIREKYVYAIIISSHGDESGAHPAKRIAADELRRGREVFPPYSCRMRVCDNHDVKRHGRSGENVSPRPAAKPVREIMIMPKGDMQLENFTWFHSDVQVINNCRR